MDAGVFRCAVFSANFHVFRSSASINSTCSGTTFHRLPIPKLLTRIAVTVPGQQLTAWLLPMVAPEHEE
jgi:hypothetical protein